MSQQLTSELVWNELRKELFAILGMVTAKGECRTMGIVYIVHEKNLYASTKTNAWPTRHIKNNPHVSMTIPIAKRIPFMPWIKIPQATITFSGTAKVFEAKNVKNEILHALFRGLESNSKELAIMSVFEIEPKGEFVTYGIGIPLIKMSNPKMARGRASVA
jgi:general stress protein 26